jgi:hypothetical protein
MERKEKIISTGGQLGKRHMASPTISRSDLISEGMYVYG